MRGAAYEKKRKGQPVKHKRSLLAVSAIGLTATLLPLLGVAQAGADYAPQPGDIVGVGGDTPQYALDFGLNGDPQGDVGYDASASVNRVVSFDATPDANGRKAYTNSVSTGVASVALNPTEILRSGELPTPRITSSSGSIAAILADYNSANPSQAEKINYIFSASLPTSAQQTQAANQGWGYLHAVEIGTDTEQIAVDSTTTNAPAGLSTAELLQIFEGNYKTWNQIPGYTGANGSQSIVLDLPSSTSTIYTTFLAALTAANSNVVPTAGSGVVHTVEQNDPSVITTSANSANVIVPFSAARLTLWNENIVPASGSTPAINGFFTNPGPGASPIAWPGGSPQTPGVTLLSGTAPDAGSAFSAPITDYVLFRNSDATGGSPLQPGGTLNWVQSLFSNPGGSTPFFDKASTKAIIDESGITANYQDLGNVTNGS